MPRKRSFRTISVVKLKELWTLYTEFKAPQLAYSTIKRDYHKIARRLTQIPKHIESSIEIRDWMLKHFSAEVSRRDIQALNACCRWAVESELLEVNPFEGLQRQIKRKERDTTWAAFTAEEQAAIIQAFDEQHPFYSPWVKFLFWTGCRPEEAAALQWQSLDGNCDRILFKEAAPVDTKRRQPTKTGKSRIFPCNDRLKSLLLSLKPAIANPEDLVFRGVKGGAFEYHNFQTRFWKPLVEQLAADGTVLQYLSEYHCRHTFITLMKPHLSDADIAYLVGNSPVVIQRHYADRSRSVSVPEI